MVSNSRRDLVKWDIIFVASLAIPSIGLVQHSLGNFYVAFWLAFQIPILTFVYYKPWYTWEKFTDQQITWVGITVLIFLFAVISIAYPLATKGLIPGANERKDIVIGAVKEIMNGKYPYYYYYTKVSPVFIWPGWLLLNILFIWAGIYWMQNCFWLFIFYLIVGKYFLNRKSTLNLIIILLLFAPVIFHELISASELLSNVLLITLIGIGILNYNSLKDWLKLPLAFLAGLAFSSRPHFLFLLPLYFSLLLQKTGLKDSVKFFAVLVLTTIAITLPFYLYDPQGFTPLQSSMYLNPFSYLAWYGRSPSPSLNSIIKTILVHTDIITLATTGIVSVILAVRNYKMNEPWYFLRDCALILFIPILIGVLSLSLALKSFEVGPYSNNGLSLMFFGCLAAWSYRDKEFNKFEAAL
ncbi:MAG: hypothetical protein M0P73_05710 [Syntrophobacterales bacterium]|jgi:hypothetical protein|nr:hypothetical protein [Syntrophobacterales bacterium]